jgi:tetratricopeptide (TPR) repeat protein
LRVLGPDHPNTIGTRHNLASLLRDRKDYAAAEPMLIEVVADRRRTQGIEHPDSLRALHALGLLYLEQKDYERAEPIWTEQVQVARRALGDTSVITVSSLANQARLYRETSRCELAEPIYREVLALAPGAYGDDPARMAGYQGSLGLCLSALGKPEQAEQMLVASYEGYLGALGADHTHTRTAAERLVEFYTSRGRPDAAAPYRSPSPD